MAARKRNQIFGAVKINKKKQALNFKRDRRDKTTKTGSKLAVIESAREAVAKGDDELVTSGSATSDEIVTASSSDDRSGNENE